MNIVNNNLKDTENFLIEEIEKCKNDFFYFFMKYCKVFHPAKGIISPEINRNIFNLITSLKEEKRIIVQKNRQTFMTTTLLLYIIWKMLFNRNENILFVSSNNLLSKYSMTKFSCFNKYLPTFFQLHLTSKNIKNYFLAEEINSGIKFISESELDFIFEKCSLIIIDEASFMDKNIIYNLSLLLSIDGQIIVTGDINNWFMKICPLFFKNESKFEYLEII